jgi:hypothetical protein
MYTISLAKDAKGTDIPVEARFTSGFISSVFLTSLNIDVTEFMLYGYRAPEPFECAIKPRSALAERLLSQYSNE